jgi:hypothetical protein
MPGFEYPAFRALVPDLPPIATPTGSMSSFTVDQFRVTCGVSVCGEGSDFHDSCKLAMYKLRHITSLIVEFNTSWG